MTTSCDREGDARTGSDHSLAALTRGARHRADIDGLRAVAVLAVILTHAGFAAVPGGFIGVDIFFVISGYLITRDLAARFAERRFSITEYYGRRLRRTLPALFFVAAATLAASAFVLMPGDFDDMARSLIGVVLLVPNIVFLTQTGYFDQNAGDKPLLHTWSLGVEEQFYLLAPLLVFALRRLDGAGRKIAIALLVAIGLAGCILLRRISPDAAFFLMPPRLFEFLIGAALAEGMIAPVRSRRVAEGLAAAALLAIAYAATRFTSLTPHPGLVTLVPCLATAVLIHVGSTRETLVGRTLALKPVAFLGLISYSLYLWHWPIFTLAHYAGLPQTAAALAAEGALCLALSVLSWRCIEIPFRVTNSIWRRRAPWLLPSGAAALALAAGFVIAGNGFPKRFPADVASVASFYSYRNHKPFREGRCFITSKDRLTDFDPQTCLKIVSGKTNVLVLGDSHAAQYWTGLVDAWPDVNFLQATASGCKPVTGASGAARCTAMMADMLRRFIPQHRLDAVMIAALWDEEDVAPLLATIAEISPRVGRTVVFGPIPRYDQPAATLIAKSMMRGDLAHVPDHMLQATKSLDAGMHAAVAPFATYVSIYTAMCPNDHCRIFAGQNVPMQFDCHHLTALGAKRLITAIHDDNAGLWAARTAQKR